MAKMMNKKRNNLDNEEMSSWELLEEQFFDEMCNCNLLDIENMENGEYFDFYIEYPDNDKLINESKWKEMSYYKYKDSSLNCKRDIYSSGEWDNNWKEWSDNDE